MSEEMNLIQVVQLPEITEQLCKLKETFEQYALDAEAMVCTTDTIQEIKCFRSDMRKAFEAVEEQRKAAKRCIMEPYEHLEAVYKECVTIPFRRADDACSRKAAYVENDIKSRCESGLRDYFDELCAVHHLDWLTYERAGIRVDMASAKAKTPKKLREQLMSFVAGVAESVDRINTLEDASEIMVEYQQSLDAADAICTVKERHRRMEEQKKFQEERTVIRAQEAEAVRRVEALAPPAQAVPAEPIVRCTFSVRATKPQLKKLKEFMNVEGIRYE